MRRFLLEEGMKKVILLIGLLASGGVCAGGYDDTIACAAYTNNFVETVAPFDIVPKDNLIKLLTSRIEYLVAVTQEKPLDTVVKDFKLKKSSIYKEFSIKYNISINGVQSASQLQAYIADLSQGGKKNCLKANDYIKNDLKYMPLSPNSTQAEIAVVANKMIEISEKIDAK